MDKICLQYLIIFMSGVLVASCAEVPPFFQSLGGGNLGQAEGGVAGLAIGNAANVAGSNSNLATTTTTLTTSTHGTAASLTPTTAEAGNQDGNSTLVSQASADPAYGYTYLSGSTDLGIGGFGTVSPQVGPAH